MAVVASSAGDVRALGDLLSGLPSSFPAAVPAVHHLSTAFPNGLEEVLGLRTALAVKAGEGGEPTRTGTVHAGCQNHTTTIPGGPFRHTAALRKRAPEAGDPVQIAEPARCS